MNNKNKGITLIALVITIIILLILAGIALSFVLGENGLINKGIEASFKSKMSKLSEELQLYLADEQAKKFESNEILDLKKIYSGSKMSEINIQDELNIQETILNNKDLMSSISQKEESYTIVFEGELYYVSSSSIDNNKNQVKWCEEIGIKIYEFQEKTGIKVINGNYEKVNGIYLCTPKLDTGFVKEKTRYIKLDSNGNLVPSYWINKMPEDDWYDYKNQKWANLYIESSGIETYIVWIPRYVYKLDNENQRSDVKFVDTDNNYIDGETDLKITWAELQNQGYQLPEAFTWDEKSVPGYWMTKYQLNELASTYTIDYNTISTTTTMQIQEIKINTDKQVAKYTYAINGKILYESTTPEAYTFTGLSKGNKTINVTALDSNGEIIGSMTKLFEVADVNPPDLTGFDRDTTFYVYWDENGIEYSNIPISKPAPVEWYDYSIRNWANIVTRNNGLESYFTWIPRYQYALDTTSQRSYVKFIKGTSTQTDANYSIPEAFTFDGKELTGYWMSKYQLSTEEIKAKLDSNISAGSSLIRIGTITGTALNDTSGNTINLKYEYYLNGDKKHEGSNSDEKYVFTGLNANTTYTITIIARNASTNEYVASIVKKLTTIEPNRPDLTGFNSDITYYITYDSDGNEVKGEKIRNDGSNIPNNWYDYSHQKWANILVENTNGAKTYLTWIPRYEYRILSSINDWTLRDKNNMRTEVNFVQGTSKETTSGGYQIPEAFTFDEKELTGYWMSKYQLSD